MSEKIKVIADNKIPFLKGALEPYVEVQYLNPFDINNNIIKDIDALIIRTRTICNKNLLENTNVKFIATATIGYDHIDTKYCEENNIKWMNAPGCNSSSVMQYISSALMTIACRQKINLSEKTIGIVGVGNVGSKVAKLSKILGMKVLLNDPPRKRNEGLKDFVELDQIISESDIITFHVPLNKSGEDKTYHLADRTFFNKIKKGAIIFNTSRGSVVDTEALKTAIKSDVISASVLDVWENEPDIDKELLNIVDIATPHIAGYSTDGKANGTAMCVRGLSTFFNLNINENWYPPEIPEPQNSDKFFIDCESKSEQEILSEVLLNSYNILDDDKRLRNSVETFEKQRGNYPVRREFPYYKTDYKNCEIKLTEKLNELGFKTNT